VADLGEGLWLPPPPLILGKKEEMTEGKQAGTQISKHFRAYFTLN